jgi:hypothetical protein
VIDALLQDPRAAQKILYVNSGDQPIANALTGVLEAT